MKTYKITEVFERVVFDWCDYKITEADLKDKYDGKLARWLADVREKNGTHESFVKDSDDGKSKGEEVYFECLEVEDGDDKQEYEGPFHGGHDETYLSEELEDAGVQIESAGTETS